MRRGKTASAVGILLGLIAIQTISAVQHEKFVPLVAFQCGYRNRYMGENGSWISDENNLATCISGKLDILKYCKKVFPGKNMTNIVEYAHEVTLADWCREEGDKCTYTQTVRPFRCIEGEFHSEALQVPHDCRFNHENGPNQCEDYNHWKKEATKLCAAKVDDKGRKLAVRSFSILEPCGLDLFSGVEFVCCPAPSDVEAATESAKEVKKELESDEDDDDEYDDEDDSDEEDEDVASSTSASSQRDSYFTQKESTSLGTEHENYREALDRQEEKHRGKVSKVMREWNELDARYNKMKKTDVKGAEFFKKEMTNRFQTTVAALEEENRKAKKEIEEVHEERVESQMNERKRIATHAYRKALADFVGKPTNKNEVLKTLKTYIRSEEKDRIHTITRFRHLLKSDLQDAMDKKGLIIHRLRYVDLRVNGTVAMLRDFPELEEQVRPIAMAFWQDFRNENSPDLSADQQKELDKVPSEMRDEKMIDLFEQQFRKEHPNAFAKIRMPTYPSPALRLQAPSTVAPLVSSSPVAKALPEDDTDSEEENDSYYEDENDEEIRKKVSKKVVEKEQKEQKEAEEKIWLKPIKVEMKTVQKEEKEAIVKPAPKANPVKEDDVSDSSEQSSEDDEDESSSETAEKDDEDEADRMAELKVDIEPIIEDKSMHSQPSFFRQDRLSHRTDNLWPFTASGYLFVVVGVLFSVFMVFMVMGMRNRRRHIRFVEVDVCSPEEKHVSGMQVNGYENPTYSFFDAKP